MKIRLKQTFLGLLTSCTLLSSAGYGNDDANQATEVEFVMYFLDASGSMSWAAKKGGRVVNTGYNGDRRWDKILTDIEGHGYNFGWSNRGRDGLDAKHVYVKFVEFDSFNHFRETQFMTFFDVVKGRRGRTTIELSQDVINEIDGKFSYHPSGSSAVYASACTAIKMADEMTDEKLKRELIAAGVQDVPENLKITEREVFFYSDLEDNNSNGYCDRSSPSPTGIGGEVEEYARTIISKYKHEPAHPDYNPSAPKEGDFKFNVVMKLFKELNGGSGANSRHGITMSDDVASEYDRMIRMSDSMNGHVHLIAGDEPSVLVAGSENCWEHGNYTCID